MRGKRVNRSDLDAAGDDEMGVEEIDAVLASVLLLVSDDDTVVGFVISAGIPSDNDSAPRKRKNGDWLTSDHLPRG